MKHYARHIVVMTPAGVHFPGLGICTEEHGTKYRNQDVQQYTHNYNGLPSRHGIMVAIMAWYKKPCFEQNVHSVNYFSDHT